MSLPGIPFTASMELCIRHGRKTATTRTKRYGRPGDRLVVGPGLVIELTSVERVSLGQVADLHYVAEGFTARQDFIATWKRIHPRKGFDPKQAVWLHRFEVVGE